MMETKPSINLHAKYPQFKFIVFAAARLEPEKNIALALDALKIVTNNYPNVGFVIAGSGSLESDLKLKTKNLKLENNVVFEGEVKDVISYCKTADLYLTTSDYEGYGLSLIEAALSGCPIVTTDAGIVGEILKDGENALVCEPGNKKCLAEKISRSITDPEFRKNIKRSAMADTLKTLTEDKDSYLELYKSMWIKLSSK